MVKIFHHCLWIVSILLISFQNRNILHGDESFLVPTIYPKDPYIGEDITLNFFLPNEVKAIEWDELSPSISILSSQNLLINPQAKDNRYRYEIKIRPISPGTWNLKGQLKTQQHSYPFQSVINISSLPFEIKPISFQETPPLSFLFDGQRILLTLQVALPDTIKIDWKSFQPSTHLSCKIVNRDLPFSINILPSSSPPHSWVTLSKSTEIPTKQILTFYIQLSATQPVIETQRYWELTLPILIPSSSSDPFSELWKVTLPRVAFLQFTSPQIPLSILHIDPDPSPHDFGIVGDFSFQWDVIPLTNIKGTYEIRLQINGVTVWERLKVPPLRVQGGNVHRPIVSFSPRQDSATIEWLIEPLPEYKEMIVQFHGSYFSTTKGERSSHFFEKRLPIDTLPSWNFSFPPFTSPSLWEIILFQSWSLPLGMLTFLWFWTGKLLRWDHWYNSPFFQSIQTLQQQISQLEKSMRDPSSPSFLTSLANQVWTIWKKIEDDASKRSIRLPSPSPTLTSFFYQYLRHRFLPADRGPFDPNFPIMDELIEWRKRVTHWGIPHQLKGIIWFYGTLTWIFSTIFYGTILFFSADTTSSWEKKIFQFYDQRDFTQAQIHAKAILQVAPNNPYIWWLLGRLNTFDRQYDHAVMAYWQAFRRLPYHFRLRQEVRQVWHQLDVDPNWFHDVVLFLPFYLWWSLTLIGIIALFSIIFQWRSPWKIKLIPCTLLLWLVLMTLYCGWKSNLILGNPKIFPIVKDTELYPLPIFPWVSSPIGLPKIPKGSLIILHSGKKKHIDSEWIEISSLEFQQKGWVTKNQISLIETFIVQKYFPSTH